MFRLFVASICMCVLLSAGWAAAQEGVAQSAAIGPSGAAYLDAIRYSGVDADVAYSDPAKPMPELETAEEPVPVPDAKPRWTIDTLTIELAATIFLGLAILVAYRAGRFSLALKGDAPNPERARRNGPVGTAAQAGQLTDLAAILAVPDRRLALVKLAQTALRQTVAANGVLLQPSWTLRDALQHIPNDQTHVDALRSLVMAGERVLFGNRDVTETEFQTHVNTIRPLMAYQSP